MTVSIQIPRAAPLDERSPRRVRKIQARRRHCETHDDGQHFALRRRFRAAGKKAFGLAAAVDPLTFPPDTYNMELVLTSGGSVAFDQFVYCGVSANTCTYTFTAPIGTNYGCFGSTSTTTTGACSRRAKPAASPSLHRPEQRQITLNGLATTSMSKRSVQTNSTRTLPVLRASQ